MSSEKSTHPYQTFLLRLRRRSSGKAMVADDDLATDGLASAANVHAAAALADWQLILIHPYTGARRTFDSAEALISFLQEQMSAE